MAAFFNCNIRSYDSVLPQRPAYRMALENDLKAGLLAPQRTCQDLLNMVPSLRYLLQISLMTSLAQGFDYVVIGGGTA